LHFLAVLLYYITDRTQLAAGESDRRAALLARIADAARCGVDYIQLREKDLTAHDLEALGRDAVRAVHENSTPTRLLINSRTDVALAVGADGVHLRADDISPSQARKVLVRAGRAHALVAVSCHSLPEVVRAETGGANFAVFGPVFEKAGEPGSAAQPAVGIAGLREVSDRTALTENRMPVLALGGITLENAAQTIKAGAAGVAGIRLFQENDLMELVKRLTN
jgi:thiamine-phosphate pyrophosphorylase